MTTKTASAEWVEGVLRQHRHLRAVVEELESFLKTPRPEVGEIGSHTWAAELSRRLLSLHDELFRHFRFEEQPETLEEIFESHPEAVTRLQEVMGEHRQMLDDLRGAVADLLAYSEGHQPEDPRLRRRIANLLARFRQHEDEENHLFQRLEYRDFGIAD